MTTKSSPAVKVSTSPAKAEVEAEETEAPGTVTITVTVRGTEVELELPATFQDADPDAIVALEEEKPTAAFKYLIGPENWAQLKRLRWTANDYMGVMKEWANTVGLGND